MNCFIKKHTKRFFIKLFMNILVMPMNKFKNRIKPLLVLSTIGELVFLFPFKKVKKHLLDFGITQVVETFYSTEDWFLKHGDKTENRPQYI